MSSSGLILDGAFLSAFGVIGEAVDDWFAMELSSEVMRVRGVGICGADIVVVAC